jgi:hypothetical protein
MVSWSVNARNGSKADIRVTWCRRWRHSSEALGSQDYPSDDVDLLSIAIIR